MIDGGTEGATDAAIDGTLDGAFDEASDGSPDFSSIMVSGFPSAIGISVISWSKLWHRQ
jgi:hypothetical protein